MRDRQTVEAEKAREIESLRKQAARAARLERLMRDAVWIEDLEPIIAGIQRESIEQKGYRPNSGKTLDDVGLSNAYFTGADDAAGEILRKIKIAVATGKEAAEHLKKSEEDAK